MKIEYDFSYLTSPKDPRLDNWIGQHFMLSYFNSEPDTSFSFRYRPYELIDGLVNGYGGTADRKQSGVGKREFVSLANRLQNNHSGIKLERYANMEVRFMHKAITHRMFHGILKETSSIIFNLLYMADNERNGRVLNDDRLTDRLQEHKESILEHYNLPIHRKDDIRAMLEDVERYVMANHDITGDTVSYAYKLFSMMELRPESIIIGEWMIGHMKTIMEAKSYLDLLMASPWMKESAIQEYITSEQTIHEGSSLTGYLNGESTDDTGVIVEYVNSERIEIFDSVKANVLIGDRPDREGVFGEYITAVDTTDTGVIIDITAGEKQISRDTHLADYLFANDNVKENEASVPHIIFTNKSASTDAHIIHNVTFVEDFGLPSSIVEHIMFAGYNYKYKDVFIEAVQTHVNIYHNDAQIDRVVTNVELLDTDALSENRQLLIGNQSEDSVIDNQIQYISPMRKDTWTFSIDMFVSPFGYDASSYWLSLINSSPKHIREMRDWTTVSLFHTDAKAIVHDVQLVTRNINRLGHSMRDDEILMTPIEIESWVNNDGVLKFNGGGDSFDSLINDDYNIKVDGLSIEARIDDEYGQRFNKMHREAWLQHAIFMMTHMEKVGIIHSNLKLFKKHSPRAYEYFEQELAIQSESIGQSMIDVNAEQVVKEVKDSSIEILFNADRETIDTYLLDLIGANREDYWEEAIKLVQEKFGREPERHGIELEHPNLSPEQERTAIVQELINAHDAYQNSREATIITDGYILSGDGSDWEDIWKRYSPGVDILDPPDSDFDYETLANKVFRKNTGVPYRPLGPTNLPDVKVGTPLHHPLPEHFDLGIDDTREMPVDNYIFIDVVLAIESLKNRNTLRYAGMPAEKTVRELFSKLFTWIQQASSGNPEYDRMFRFARWYAESVVISLSKHILHREYNPWRSTYHTFGDLGIPYTSVNWDYIPAALSSQTTDTHAYYKFSVENYIDGELIVRGYFDNPLNEGTMKIVIDGTPVKTINRRGGFSETIEVPQGNHTYEFVFNGTSGRVSLSTIEISGCEFISAYTTSDDSDTNGLKACTVLINNLLSYFDKHHGGGKIKGTMEVKQRRVWNAQT